jgi:hypothetical protein
MSNLPPRNRVIYQSEALFISPDCTGYHMYYYPPQNARAATKAIKTVYDADCFVSDGTIHFDACSGVLRSAADKDADVLEDLKYVGLPCSGTEEIHPTGAQGALSGLHPILIAAGFDIDTDFTAGSNKDDGLKYLSNTSTKTGAWGSAAEQLKRVQSANYSFTVNRQDVNQFGHLGRLDSVVLESPTVSLDFSYYVTDGENERLLGFVTDGQNQSLSGIMTRGQNEFGNNYFILTVPEGRDAVLGDQLVEEENKSVIGLGNAYITDYSVEASVGSFPTASVTVEGMNMKSDIGTDFKIQPAIDPTDGTLNCTRCFFLPPAATGDGESVLKPGDITIDLQNASLISKQISGTTAGYGAEDKGSAHIQSFTLSTPMGRTDLQRLGSSYAYAKEVDFPITCTLTVNALVADLKEGNLLDILCGETYDMTITMQDPQCPIKCDPNNQPAALTFQFKKAVLDSESFSSAIGDNKTVDLTFTTQIAGPEERAAGVFIKGKENAQHNETGPYRSPPQVKRVNDENGKGRLKFYPYGSEYGLEAANIQEWQNSRKEKFD